VVVLAAYEELQQIQRQQAAINELGVAQLTALMANVNRDPAKTQPFATEQFCFFREQQEAADGLSPEVAAVALALRHEDRCPPLLLTIWPDILKASKTTARPPAVRALRSDDDAVWVLAPRWEGRNVRGGLVVVRGQLSGRIVLRELDRPLIRHEVRLPQRKGFGWLEADLLLAGEPTP
jgi:hypothetical protein